MSKANQQICVGYKYIHSFKVIVTGENIIHLIPKVNILHTQKIKKNASQNHNEIRHKKSIILFKCNRFDVIWSYGKKNRNHKNRSG